METTESPTGNLEVLESFVDVKKVDGNWVIGTVKGYGHGTAEIHMKLFAEGSEFGIEDGRISKLSIFTYKKPEDRNTSKRKMQVNYDRGWDVKPKEKFFQLFVNQLVKHVG